MPLQRDQFNLRVNQEFRANTKTISEYYQISESEAVRLAVEFAARHLHALDFWRPELVRDEV